MTTLTVWKFDSEGGARNALQVLERLQKQELIQIVDGAIVTWPPDRKKPKTEQLRGLTGAGALGGAFWGLLFGLLFFIPLLGMAIGAGMGALMGSMTDVGIDDDFIRKVRDEVTPGHVRAVRDERERGRGPGARRVQGHRGAPGLVQPVERAGGEAAGGLRRGRGADAGGMS